MTDKGFVQYMDDKSGDIEFFGETSAQWEKTLEQLFQSPQDCCPNPDIEKTIDESYPDGWVKMRCKNCGKDLALLGPEAQRILEAL